MLAGLVCHNAFTGFGYILGSAVGDKQTVTILTPVLVVPTMLFAGFFVNQDKIPKVLLPIREITIFKYCYQALYVNEFTGLELDCMSAQG